MKIVSKDFGQLEIEEQEILHFERGLFAFEEVADYILLEKDGYFPKWLQSVRGAEPRFIVCDPADIAANYRPRIPDAALRELDIAAGGSYRLYVVAVVPEDIKKMTVNLKSPLVVNPQNNRAAQIILDDQDYPVRHRVFQDEEGL